MYCKNCGAPINDGASVCVKCGFTTESGGSYCAFCGAPMQAGAAFCPTCGHAAATMRPLKSKMAAGLLGVFVGGFGVHNFYLGYTGKGVAQIILNFCCGIGAIWGFIEGILILTGAIDRDADGNPLGQ